MFRCYPTASRPAPEPRHRDTIHPLLRATIVHFGKHRERSFRRGSQLLASPKRILVSARLWIPRLGIYSIPQTPRCYPTAPEPRIENLIAVMTRSAHLIDADKKSKDDP